MQAEAFRSRLQAHLRSAGYTQKQLAHELGLHPHVLSHKLHQSDGMQITAGDVKRMIVILAAQGVLYDRAQALDLLEAAAMTAAAFSNAEWSNPPLNHLTAESSVPSLVSKRVEINVPNPPTALIGRDALLQNVEERFSTPDVRLMTLTGPGGVGKTRIAVALAQRVASQFEDGVFFVPLADIDNSALVGSTIAHKLRLRDLQRDALQSLKNYLQDKKLLLVLDNFEHVLDAAPLVGVLIDHAPALKILITSQVVLNRYGEHQVTVAPLVTSEHADFDHLAASPAPALFAARAGAVRSDFRITPENIAAVAEICKRLDGLPLAIELAAARLRLFSPAALLDRLELPMLAARDEGLPLRQQTLQQTIGWSFRLLPPQEREVFLIASLFPAGCSLEAGEALCGAVAVNSFSALLDKSLIQEREGLDGYIRFHMLQTVREFAHEQINTAGRLDAVREQQAAYYRTFVETTAAQLLGDRQIEALNHLEAEHDNLRAVLAWSVNSRPEIAVALIGALGQFWSMRGYALEGLRWAAPVLEQDVDWGALDDGLKASYARAYNTCGALAFVTGDYDRAQVYLQGALTLRLQLEDHEGLASTYNNLGNLAWNQSELAVARRYFEEAARIAEEIENWKLVASVSNNLGTLLQSLHDLPLAQRYLFRALEIWRRLGNKQSIANTLSNLGGIASAQQDFAQAMTYYLESLALQLEAGNKRNAGAVLANMGEIALRRGEFDEAQQHFERTLALQREVDYLWGTGSALCDLGRAAFYRGDYGTALARLQESLSMMRSLKDNAKIALALEFLGVTMLKMRDLAGARRHLREALHHYQEQEDQPGMASTLTGIGSVYAMQGDFLRAARIWGAAFGVWAQHGTQPLATDHLRFALELDSARAASIPAEFDAVWKEGEAAPTAVLGTEME